MIKITSPLSQNQRQRLYRAAMRYEHDFGIFGNFTEHAFGKSDHHKNCYFALLPEPVSEHNVARHMMVVAGTTFRYEII